MILFSSKTTNARRSREHSKTNWIFVLWISHAASFPTGVMGSFQFYPSHSFSTTTTSHSRRLLLRKSKYPSSSSTTIYGRRVDSSKAIEDAMEKSRIFGPQSSEARVAWDIVEEMDASDNLKTAFEIPEKQIVSWQNDSSKAVEDANNKSRMYGPHSKQARVAWDIVEEMNASDNIKKAFKIPEKEIPSNYVYANQINTLSDLLDTVSNTLTHIKFLASTIQQLEINDPSITKGSPQISKHLADALQQARAADAIHGTGSTQASQAWDHVQLISSGVPDVVATVLQESKTSRYKESAVGSHHQYYTIVDPRSLEDAVEAIGSLEHLARQVRMECDHLNKNGGMSRVTAPRITTTVGGDKDDTVGTWRP